MPMQSTPSVVATELVRLGAKPASKDAAIDEAAQLLVAAGCIDSAYIESMKRREVVSNTYLGKGVAIPHGMVEDRDMVHRSGIAVLQVPDGVRWSDGQMVHLVVAIGAQSDTHIAILRRLTRLMQDEVALQALITTSSAADIVRALSEDAPVAASAGASGAEVPRPASDLDHSWAWTVDYPNGLHARPASQWVAAAREFEAHLQVRKDDDAADCKGLVPLLQLGLQCGDNVVISAQGTDADVALRRLQRVITGLSAQEKADAASAAEKARARSVVLWQAPQGLLSVAGQSASPGLALAPAYVLRDQALSVDDVPQGLAEGGERLHQALTLTGEELRQLADDTGRRLGAGEAEIFHAQASLLQDSDLVTVTCQLMVQGHGVAWSWHQAIEQAAKALAASGNEVLAGRAADLRDVGRRVLVRLDPQTGKGGAEGLPDHPVVLIARDLSPSDTATLDMSRIVGLATAQGGATSHTAILARTLGLPAVVGMGDGVLDIDDETSLILDGAAGRLYLTPSEDAVASAQAWQAADQERRRKEEAERGLPAATTDGHRIEIAANINRADQAPMALSQGADGVGLMRTEFLFLERQSAPDEDEQAAAYSAMQSALDGRPLIVRALDIGGDKQVAHLHLPHEDNPFLGVRGSRLLLRRSDLLETQVRALYRAAKSGQPLSIMFPMITSEPEIRSLRRTCEAIREELGAPEVPLGIMVEVPAAAMMADRLAEYVDFFSIGTNDLTQYSLAIDRQHPDLAAEADSLHPAVLRLISETVRGAAAHDRWVGVCGGLAGDPFGASLLTGLGVNELSMTPRDIPGVKARLRSSSFAQLKTLAEKALDCLNAEEVRALDSGPQASDPTPAEDAGHE